MTSEDKETIPKIEEPKGEATPVTDPIKQVSWSDMIAWVSIDQDFKPHHLFVVYLL